MVTHVSRSHSCSLPSPNWLQYVLFWNFQFSYEQSTLSTTCFCTFWNGALRQINENKYGRVPIKILQTVSSMEYRRRRTFYLFIYCGRSVHFCPYNSCFICLFSCQPTLRDSDYARLITTLLRLEEVFFFAFVFGKSAIFLIAVCVLRVNARCILKFRIH